MLFRSKRIDEINNQEILDLDNIKKQKQKNIIDKTSSSYNNPDKIVNDIANKYGFEVYKQ